MGQVHGLVLMLLTTRMIEPVLSTDDVLGRKNIKMKDIMLHLAKDTMDKVMNNTKTLSSMTIHNGSHSKFVLNVSYIS